MIFCFNLIGRTLKIDNDLNEECKIEGERE
jgi:hypothetical protein